MARRGSARRLWVCSGSLAVVLCAAGAAGASPLWRAASALDLGALDAYLEQEVAARRLPGLAVTIVEGDRIVMVRGYGSAAARRPVTPRTQFYIGSCTKSFTALAVMQLVEQGRLALDAPVRRYLAEFTVADELASGRITVRHLLNQTSGLGEAGDPQPHRSRPSLAGAVRALRDVRPTAPAGTVFQYYNPNYRVLGLLVERASGQSYGDYLRDHVLVPLGMTRTLADPGRATELAQGHARVFGFTLSRPQPFDPGALSSGYLISCAEDLGHYLVALLGGASRGRSAIARAETLEQLFTPPEGVDSRRAAPPDTVTRLLGSPSGVESGYAMGWLVARRPDGLRLVFHGGSLERFRADMLLIPELRRGLVVLVNQNGMLAPLLDPNPPWMSLAHAMLGRSGPPPRHQTWRTRLFALVVALDLGIGLLRIGRLPRWRRKAAGRSRAALWSRALVDVALPGAFLVGFPKLLGPVVRADVTWPGFFDFLPDLALWLAASATLSLARGAGKVAILARATS
jgi:CubicO group peptidase (beta-lactamase class C family)